MRSNQTLSFSALNILLCHPLKFASKIFVEIFLLSQLSVIYMAHMSFHVGVSGSVLKRTGIYIVHFGLSIFFGV